MIQTASSCQPAPQRHAPGDITPRLRTSACAGSRIRSSLGTFPFAQDLIGYPNYDVLRGLVTLVLMQRIKVTCSIGIGGRPGLRERQHQYRWKPRRCQAITVAGLTIIRAERQDAHALDRITQRLVPEAARGRASGSGNRQQAVVAGQGSQ